MAVKKEADPKFIDVMEKLVAYSDFAEAIKQIEYFDVQLARLGYLKSQKLESEVREI